MPVALDLSKAVQEQVLATLKQGQDATLASVDLWAKNVSQVAGAQPAFDVPTPEQLVANSFGFAEKLLASQQEFAQKVVSASAAALRRDARRGQEVARPTPSGGLALPTATVCAGERRALERAAGGARRLPPCTAPGCEPLAPRDCPARGRLERLPQPDRARAASAVHQGDPRALRRPRDLDGDAPGAGGSRAAREQPVRVPTGGAARPGPAATVAAILADPSLTPPQREALLTIYRTYTSDAPADAPGGEQP